MIGKIRLGASTRRNHGWNIPFHVTGRGITTRPMGADPIFTIDFDFLNHRLDINTPTDNGNGPCGASPDKATYASPIPFQAADARDQGRSRPD